MRKWMLIAAGIETALALTATWGCAERTSPQYFAEAMRDAPTVTYGAVTVHYSKGLDKQAACFAGTVDAQLSYIQSFTGYELQPKFRKWDVYLRLLESDAPRQGVIAYMGDVLLWVDPNKTSCADIVEKNDSDYPFAWTHELVEGSLCVGKLLGTKPRLLLDDRPSADGKTAGKAYYTRWFREGFASYCGILACRAADLNEGAGRGEIRSEMFIRGIDLLPFSSLARLGKRLFAWRQCDDYADYAPDPNAAKDAAASPEALHYDAALGLFLLIEARYGQSAIRDITREVNRLKNGTGEDIEKIVSKAIGTDVVKLADEFRFPDVGLMLATGYRPSPTSAVVRIEGGLMAIVSEDSPAQRAGIKSADIVLGLDGEPTLRNLDFECALLKRMGRKSVELRIRRRGAEPRTVEVRLSE